MTKASRLGGLPLIAAGVGVVVVVVVVTGLGGLVVAGRGGEDHSAPAPTSATTRPEATGTTTSTTAPSATAPSTITPSTITPSTITTSPGAISQPSIEGREVPVQASSTVAFEAGWPLVDRLSAQSVLRISASGFEEYGTGSVEQCTVAGCANPFPVLFDANGTSLFQYLVSDAFAAGLTPSSTCRADAPPCVVRVRGNGRSAFVKTVFRDPAPAARRLTVEPSAVDLASDDRVRVTARGFIPGERVQAMLCVAPATNGAERCGAPGPVATLTIGANGSGRTELAIRAGRVGSAGASCGRGATCGIVVSQAHSSVPATVVPISFAAGPSAHYDPVRWLAGTGIALVLIALAMFLVRTTDWRKPTEADTPDLDRAVFVDDLG